MRIRVLHDLIDDELYLVGDDGNYYQAEQIKVSLDKIDKIINTSGSALAMDDERDRIKFLSLLLENIDIKEEEREEMQEVPNDAIILTPEEAQAIVDYLDEVRYPDEEEPLASAIRALNEQLEFDDTE